MPSTLSLHDHSLWGLSSHLLLLGRIPISKWGLRPNTKVHAFAPTITYLLNLSLNSKKVWLLTFFLIYFSLNFPSVVLYVSIFRSLYHLYHIVSEFGLLGFLIVSVEAKA